MPIPTGYAAFTKVSAKERVLGQLQRWIIDGTFVPGEKLMDLEVAEALGVSRTPIREAFQILEMQGFVEIHQGKETRVTNIEKDDILKIYPPFAALQSLAVEIVTPTISNAQIEKLRGINLEFAELLENEQPYKAMEYDEDFHNLIVEIADNPYISLFTSNLQMHIRRFKYLFLKQISASEHTSIDEHEQVIRALEEKDSNAASLTMKRNILRPMQELYEKL